MVTLPAAITGNPWQTMRVSDSGPRWQQPPAPNPSRTWG